MKIFNSAINLNTKGSLDFIDISGEVCQSLSDSGIRNGLLNLIIPGSTAGITTIEYEAGVISDFKKAIERLAPANMHYEHNRRWRDGNGFSHVRAALLKASLTLPVLEQRLVLGVWQQIVFLEFDNRPRQRKVIIQIMGE